MAGSVKVKGSADLAEEIYRNVRMASESILDLMPRVRSEKLKGELTAELEAYEGLASRAAALVKEAGGTPDDGSAWARMGAKWGILMNVAKDATEEHLVQMMIEGTTMGVGELLRWIRAAEGTEIPVSEEAIDLAKETCHYEEKTVERLKDLLRA